MWVLIVIGALVGLVVIALSVPLCGRVTYDGELRVNVRILGIPIALLPSDQKPAEVADTGDDNTKKSRSKRHKQSDKPSRAEQLKQELTKAFREDGVGALMQYIGKLADLVGGLAKRLARTVTVRRLELELIVADPDDPAQTAIRYGQICSVLYPALAAIGRVVRVRERRIRVEPNFLADEGRFFADVRIHASAWRFIGALVWFLIHYRQIDNTDSTGGNE